jgi:hypothetical protein
VCRVEKLGAPKNVDPKAKGPVSDFTLDVNELKTLAVENFEGKEEGVSIRFEPSSMADSKAILYITSNEGGEVYLFNLVLMHVKWILSSSLA